MCNCAQRVLRSAGLLESLFWLETLEPSRKLTDDVDAECKKSLKRPADVKVRLWFMDYTSPIC